MITHTDTLVTAETLTDKQIREERRMQREDGNRINVEICNTALRQFRGARGQVLDFQIDEVLQARRLVAAAINARRSQ